ncbi:MAG: hypothetical protein LUH15_20070 [Tannerellaceae bacterium]|nr:hypothetical protein [Tannerellaceae bacterium]
MKKQYIITFFFFFILIMGCRRIYIPDPEFVQENHFEFMTIDSDCSNIVIYDSAFIQDDSIKVRIFYDYPYFHKYRYYNYNNIPVYEFFTYYSSSQIYRKERLHGKFLFKMGKEYFYDKKGKVTKIIDHEELFSFTLEDVYNFAEKYPMPLHKIKRYKEDLERPYWYVIFEDTTNIQKAYAFCIDGQTGEVFKEYIPVKRTKKLTHPLPFMLTSKQYDEYIYGKSIP